MVDVPNQLELDLFCSSGAVAKPSSTRLSTGYLAGEQLPAEHFNYLLNRTTKESIDANTELINILTELKRFLTAASLIPDSGSTTQLKSAVDALYAKHKIVSVTDLNAISGDGVFFETTNSCASMPSGYESAYATGYQSYWNSANTDIAQMLAINGTSGAWFLRRKTANVWGAWAKLWNANNDGSESGLDADLHDGYHAGHSSGQIPVSDGTVNANLNAQLVRSLDFATGAAGISGTVAFPTGIGHDSGLVWGIPQGLYVLSFIMTSGTSNSNIYIRVNNGSNGWAFTKGLGLILSDGINYEVWATSDLKGTLYYRKLV